jgi:type I restriction-modification system DNA methylase subunit
MRRRSLWPVRFLLGLVFKALIRTFAELSNETAGEHFMT